MLFDLRGRGRRNTIKVIYISLAFLMGGGLVFFGIGGNTSGGGLVDAITGADDGGASGAERYENQIKDSETRLTTNPNDRGALEQLISARVQLASFEGRYNSGSDSYTAEGLEILRQAGADWERYAKLDIPTDDAKGDAANRAATAFLYLENNERYLEAQQVVAEARNTTGPYQQLAVAAYQLNRVPLGDKAAAKAIELATDTQKDTVKNDLEAAKTQLAQGGAQAPVQTVTATPSESPETSPKPEQKSAGKQRKPGKKSTKRKK